MERPIAAVLLTVLLGLPATAGAQGFAQVITLANAADSLGHFGAAAVLYEKAYTLSGFDPTGLAVAATEAAKAGDRARAFRDLNAAVDQGFVDPRLFADSAFVPLRKDPRWAALGNKLKARIARVNQALRDTLLRLADQDQKNRQGFGAVMEKFGAQSAQGDSARRALVAADAPVQARLREIIAQHGWPTRATVADDGAHAAWLVMQHMPLIDQAAVLPKVLAAVKVGDARAGDGALLEDRVLVGSHRPQRYGTQLSSAPMGGRPTVDSIENPACVDVRRKTVGLEPLAEYLKGFGVVYTVKGVCH